MQILPTIAAPSAYTTRARTARTEPVSATQSIWAKRLNIMLQRAWSSGWAAEPLLDPDAILAAGQRGIGAAAFADRFDWLDRLDDLTAALHATAKLNALGRTIAFGQLARVVRHRTKLEKLWQHRPEILDTPLLPPVIVLGHMRSGTTRMQRMLATDSRFAATRFCDSWFPLPPRGVDLRPAKAWAALQLTGLINPGFAAIHPTAPRAVDEEIGWLSLGLSTTPFDAQWRIPSFAAANRWRDPEPVYRLLKRIKQTHQWRRKGPLRPWVLKVPQFMDDLDALLRVFPDARLVHVMRDPAAVVASSCSLVANQMAVHSDSVDPAAIGSDWLDRTARRDHAARTRLERQDVPVTAINYVRMDRDWRSAMREVYRMLRLPLPDTVIDRMERQAVLHSRPTSHQYKLEDYGLTPAQVRERLGLQPTISSGLKK